ncbi:hypothetical protein M2451_002527 [Dysgonomonas sp. PFB1-18]|uniref:hypothetical protein n=1 Tax=unclassified Dysgonomonas TaxID=2630389 RepID=UPI00247315FA|nr:MULTISPECIES: hypothetical protein [unclassified Dysgonomonas]MDH6308008.1 hypothetical protein [Dysgonomonas sp. PF1-14]MDH6339547.1 hypothetical protein [Dysgonomonas sp. PF1-16]MDH6381198.1 hypothetical protein [Dysgonomonas sp. PFB1-18]MDH6398410.1 hypothetical protein [Dysgonomonas sp. PF1-23]
MVITAIYIIIAIVVLYIALRLIHKIYPLDPVTVGKTINIYQDNTYNRTATVTGLHSDRVVIYDVLPLPVHYRGRFYSVGYTSDGYSLMFIGRKKLYFLARLAELIRKIANTPEYQGDLLGESAEETTEPVEGVDDEM